MSEDYKLQVSIKFGPGLVGMLNIRANTLPEMEGLLEDAEMIASGKLAGLTEDLAGLSNIQAAFPEAQVISNTPAANVKVCGPNGSHGAMTERWGNKGTPDEWHGWFCSLPKGDPNKCKPVYPK